MFLWLNRARVGSGTSLRVVIFTAVYANFLRSLQYGGCCGASSIPYTATVLDPKPTVLGVDTATGIHVGTATNAAGCEGTNDVYCLVFMCFCFIN